TEPALDLIKALAELVENVSANPVADHLQDIGHVLPTVTNPLENRLNNIIVKRVKRVLQRVPRGANNVFPHPLNAVGHCLPTGLNEVENRHEDVIPHELRRGLQRIHAGRITLVQICWIPCAMKPHAALMALNTGFRTLFHMNWAATFSASHAGLTSVSQPHLIAADRAFHASMSGVISTVRTIAATHCATVAKADSAGLM